MQITFTKPAAPKSGVAVAFAFEGCKLAGMIAELDAASGGSLTRAMEVSRFDGKAGKTLTLITPAGLTLDRLVLVGLGAPDKLDELTLQNAGGSAWANIAGVKAKSAAIFADVDAPDGMTAGSLAANIAFGAVLRSYRFDKYRTKEKKEDKPQIGKLSVATAAAADAKKAFAPMEAVAGGVFLTRDLVSEPPNVLYPESYAKLLQELKEDGIKVEVLGEKEMAKLGMGALLGVGQGSIRESKLVVMQWNGAGKKEQPVAFVGKGVCFDTGGISIKPAAGMEDMKWDMGGSGVVAGLMKALAARKAKVNAVGVVGLVENMPDGNAQRPGDVVTSMSGQTIEIINTDAEGRLVLADALWYTNDRFKPQFMVDLATLTGAIIISLGNEHAGLFSNNDELSEKLTAAGKAVHERLWRMPMGDDYDKQLKSDIADMRNTGTRAGGSITAAQFLQRYVKDTPWAHLDIAGVTWSKKDDPTVPKGGTAFGVRLLDRFVADNYES
jgi:leucyl aminopeptidase